MAIIRHASCRGVLRACFLGPAKYLHPALILVTFALVWSGTDWWYAQHVFASPTLRAIGAGAFRFGIILPFVVPLLLVLYGRFLGKKEYTQAASVAALAAALSFAFTVVLKALSGRLPPAPIGSPLNLAAGDTSHFFHFGLLRKGIFYGWPSGHTTVAVAITVSLLLFMPQRRVLWGVLLLCAAYIGFGVSTHVHWLSDVAAGALLGVIVGSAVARPERT